MKTKTRLGLSGIFAAGVICLSSCDYDANEVSAQADFDTLTRDGRLLNGKDIAIAACLRANPHGMEIINCSSTKIGIPLEPTDKLMRSTYPRFYEMALRSQVESKPPPKVYLCGAFHLASQGDGRWIVVDSMSGSGFPIECRGKKGKDR
ncbi:MAG TPA: hypothetical protein VJM34_13885 [Novosphingobium sp.]|uniref:hypothetical protein n=1 Tax=Lysobacter sp. ESA13C TaxID=2862676 RepID=UPI001CC134C4|nr:hypothetical protein [Lysobacter sp. ESA13C]HKX79604.1 hypothetical protein [Novosphingobium sp.]